MKSLLVDTVPKDARNRGSINLGFEIVREKWAADFCHWSDKIDASKYDRIGFNVFYATHMLNVGPFLRRNGIANGTGKTIAGGQGVGWRGALSGIIDEVFAGEIDEECAKQIVSRPIIRDGKAVVELSRGCRHRCGFCEYAHNHALRFKPIDLVKQQVDEVADYGCRRVNFMSTDFGGYPHLDELMEHALRRGMQILNGDYCVTSVPKVLKWLKYLPRQLKLGVESFYEPARREAGKRFSDEMLLDVVGKALETASAIHFYLIYGLPGDNYDHWFRWLDKLTALRTKAHTAFGTDLFGDTYKENKKNVRFEFNITNFEPCDGTPMADVPLVDFEEKARFIAKWSDAMIRNGLFVGERMDYVNSGGRIGRKELSYRMLMALKRGGPELSDALMNALPNGVGRSISDKEADRFLECVAVSA